MTKDRVNKTPWLRVVFRLVGAGFSTASLFHAVAIFVPSIAEPSPAWRHGLFVFINAAVALGFFYRPQFFAWLLSVLTLQQLYSHGMHGWEVLVTQERVDWASVLVWVTLPPLTALVWWDRQTSIREPRPRT